MRLLRDWRSSSHRPRRTRWKRVVHALLESSVGRRLLDVDVVLVGRRVGVFCRGNGVQGSWLGADAPAPFAVVTPTPACSQPASAGSDGRIRRQDPMRRSTHRLLRGAGGAGGTAGRHAAGDCLQPRRGVAAAFAPLKALHDVLRHRWGPDAAEHSGRHRREARVSPPRVQSVVRGYVEGVSICAARREQGVGRGPWPWPWCARARVVSRGGRAQI